MPKLLRNQRAFTLIELLIVVIIVSILALFTFVSFTTVQKNARDAQRKGDLQAVAGVLQRFYSDFSIYPSSSSGQIAYNTGSCGNDTGQSTIAWGTGSITCNGKSYTKQLPNDPQSTPYCYERTSQQNYNLYAKLEGQGNVSPAVSCGGGSSGYNYRVTPND